MKAYGDVLPIASRLFFYIMNNKRSSTMGKDKDKKDKKDKKEKKEKKGKKKDKKK